jgi:D-psicose/D-tagatose/L-ribulose 3-epimerase
VPWADVAGALDEIGYDGPVVIESFNDHVNTIARAAAIWRPLASSQDALARDGLMFLRRLLAAR